MEVFAARNEAPGVARGKSGNALARPSRPGAARRPNAGEGRSVDVHGRVQWSAQQKPRGVTRGEQTGEAGDGDGSGVGLLGG
jgi:hypothetical protein